ncbi:MAG: hypothetical protein JXN65_03040 [Clostridia bacterium]|nr:hypothetical protein [Clostridia bacterium]
MKKLTSRTKKFIISAILVHAIVIISALILITTNTINFYSKGMLLYTGTLILLMIISAVFIRKRIKDNHKVISEKDIDLERYEEANDMLTFEVINKKEKKHIINSIAEWLDIEKKGNKTSQLDIKGKVKTNLADLGYNKLNKNLLRFLLSSLFFAILLCVYQIEQFIVRTDYYSFFDVNLAPSTIFYFFALAFFWTYLYIYLYQKGKMLLANCLPLVSVAVHLLMVALINRFNFDNPILNYIIGGQFGYIKNFLRLIIVIAFIVINYLIQKLVRKKMVKANVEV